MENMASLINQCDLIVLDIGYNILVCGIIGTEKKIYIHKFPPALNTTEKPIITNTKSDYTFEINSELRKESAINFWKSTDLFQLNGDWKGGEWGSNNFPTTSTDFCTDVFIGDVLSLGNIIDGIIPYPKRKSKPFEEGDQIIPGSENFAWSANITLKKTNITYSCYVCDKPMPQSAIDVLFVWENSRGHQFVKILKRGLPNPNLDMSSLLMPGAGEHREPGNKICFKSDALEAIKQEIGICQTTLSNCYLIPVGTYNEDKRDPRYWSYSVNQDGKIITFGPERKSETSVYVLYIKTDTDVEPAEIEHEDKIEVGKKYWIGLDNPILSNKEIWMIPEHSLYFEPTRNVLDLFQNKEQSEKELYKIIMDV